MNRPFKDIQKTFLELSIRNKHLVFVLLLIFFIAATGMMAFRGVHKVYKYSSPLAKTSYPLASHVVNALHSLEVSRAISIQYAFEQDMEKVGFLKKRFESEFQHSQELLGKIDELKALPKSLEVPWKTIQKTQHVFQEVGKLLIKTHDEQLALSKERNDQIQEANRLVSRMTEILGSLTQRYENNSPIQFLAIAGQVMLLEQRYLYQPNHSSSSKEEEKKVLQNKEKFQIYVDKFNQNSIQLAAKIQNPKHRTLLTDLTKLYSEFLDRVKGENGIFLIREDEIAKLSTIEFKLAELESAYSDGSKASLLIQKSVSQHMDKAADVILSLKSSSYWLILGFTFFFAIVGTLLGLFITEHLVRPIEDLTHAAKEIGQGHWNERVKVATQDEVGQLALTFNEMANQVQELNQGLEKRVQERTQELEQANMRLTKASDMKTEFLSTVSHDLKTPLNAILGFTQIILSDPKNLSPQQNKNLNTVLKSAKDLLHMIDLILDFSKMEASKMGTAVIAEEFPFESLLDECLESIEIFVRNKPIELLKEVQTHLPKLKTDRPKVKRILLNLLSNAAKATEKGKIEVSVHKKDDHFLQFLVQDTGRGIAPENLPTLFERFKLKEHEVNPDEGAGLGLSITKKLVMLLGGTIGVQSKPGEGTTFTVTVPFEYHKEEKKEAA